jgi:hypothetical protein
MNGVIDPAKLKASDPLLHPHYKDLLHDDNQFIAHVYELVAEHIYPPYAVSIDGSWGTGKTTVMQLLCRRLEKKNRPICDTTEDQKNCAAILKEYPTFWFNPWEYQDAESIVLAFLKRFTAETLQYREKLKKTLKILGFLGYISLDTFLSAIPSKILNIQKTYKEFERQFDSFVGQYETYNDLIEVIKSDFKKLVNTVSEEHEHRPVIIFFDDLDRCLPDRAIQLLEAIKNLFVVKDTQVIFICGIDTNIAKQFIIKQYSGIKPEFAVNYFRKIFNLTIRMPFRPHKLKVFLREHIQRLYTLEDDQSFLVADFIAQLGLDAGLTSLRNYASVIDNLQVFCIFNHDNRLKFDSRSDFKIKKETLILVLLVFQQTWPLLYENFSMKALQKDRYSVFEISELFINTSTSTEEQRPLVQSLSPNQQEFFSKYLLNKEFSYYSENLCDWLQANPIF